MKAAQIDSDSIADLDISNFKAIDAALKVRYNCIKITALEDGVALAPPKTDESDYFGVGARIKGGETLVLIGDMSGLSLSIAVTEIDVREVKVGQKAIITGVAFPELQLEGEVTHVDAQAKSSHRSGLPLFPVKIEVKNLTDAQRKIIKVGMSSKIKLNITLPGVLEIPIRSVFKKGDQTVIYKYVKGEKIETAVTTGRTTMNTVEILDGIQEGDQVVVVN
jgi:HlyD family secretion protein